MQQKTLGVIWAFIGNPEHLKTVTIDFLFSIDLGHVHSKLVH